MAGIVNTFLVSDRDRIKIGICDAHQFVHDALKSLCAHPANRFEIVLTACSALEAENEISTPDILVLDPGDDVSQTLKWITRMKSEQPALRILIFSGHCSLRLIADMFEAGANGYVQKSESFEKLSEAINLVITEGHFCHHDLSKLFSPRVNSKSSSRKKFTGNVQFSKREIEIVRLTMEQLTNLEIAERLSLSIKTIEKNKSNMMLKTDSKKFFGVLDYLIQNDII